MTKAKSLIDFLIENVSSLYTHWSDGKFDRKEVVTVKMLQDLRVSSIYDPESKELSIIGLKYYSDILFSNRELNQTIVIYEDLYYLIFTDNQFLGKDQFRIKLRVL